MRQTWSGAFFLYLSQQFQILKLQGIRQTGWCRGFNLWYLNCPDGGATGFRVGPFRQLNVHKCYELCKWEWREVLSPWNDPTGLGPLRTVRRSPPLTHTREREDDSRSKDRFVIMRFLDFQTFQPSSSHQFVLRKGQVFELQTAQGWKCFYCSLL